MPFWWPSFQGAHERKYVLAASSDQLVRLPPRQGLAMAPEYLSDDTSRSTGTSRHPAWNGISRGLESAPNGNKGSQKSPSGLRAHAWMALSAPGLTQILGAPGCFCGKSPVTLAPPET